MNIQWFYFIIRYEYKVNIMNYTKMQTDTNNLFKWFLVITLVYLLLIAVAMIGSGFKLIAGQSAKELFEFATNPIVSLVIGMMATAIIQSSSTVTSIIVGLVAGGLPISIAIPMVMGANIGTTITNTLVSIGHIKKAEEFKRAFSAATVHDFFNLISVVIFLPLEIMFGFLEKIGSFLANLFIGTSSLAMSEFNFIKPLIKPPIKFIQENLIFYLQDNITGILMCLVGVFLIFFVITYIGKLLKTLMVGRVKDILHMAIGKGAISGITSGTAVTVLVQSSSTTTSLIVPLAGHGIFSLKQIYPFTLGANIGTTITAILAATAITGDTAIFALQIALIHFIYNLFGVIVIYGIPFLREIPLWCANALATLTIKNKLYAILYIALVFFAIPLVLIMLSY